MFLQILIWILFFSVVFAISNFLFIRKGIDYFHKYYILVVYYFLCTCLAFVFYADLLNLYFESIKHDLIYVLMGVVVLSVLIVPLMNKKLGIPRKFSKKHNGFFLRMDHRMIVAKLADIIFQEVMILALLLILLSGGVEYQTIFWSFFVIFPLVHLPLIFMEGWFSLFYVLSALLGGAFLPLLILKTGSGFYWAVIFHWLVYLLGRLGFGVYFESHCPKYWFFRPHWVSKKIKKIINN